MILADAVQLIWHQDGHLLKILVIIVMWKNEYLWLADAV